MRFWLSIPEINKSRKAMEWLTCLSIVNLMLGCLLFKTFKRFNESCSFSKPARMSSIFSTIANNLVCIRNSLYLNFWMFQIKMLYQYVKDSFGAPSIDAIKNFNMSHKNSVNLKPFYTNSYLLLISTSLTDL